MNPALLPTDSSRIRGAIAPRTQFGLGQMSVDFGLRANNSQLTAKAIIKEITVRNGNLDGFDQRVGGRVRTLRKRRNMTQAALASQLGVTKQQVQKYESGASVIAPVHLARACKVLHTSPNVLFGYGVDTDHVTPDTIAAMVAAINALPEELRSMTVDWWNVFAQVTQPRKRSKP